MHDIRWIRDNPDAFDAGLARRGLKPMAGALIALDEKRREITARLQAMQERRNSASKEIGKAKASGDEARASALMAEVSAIKEKMPEDEAAQREVEDELHETLSGIPNLPLDDVPDGPDETANVELRRVGEPRKLGFAPKQHFELGEGLGLMDFETAAKLSGSRFVVLRGALARLERALGAFMLDLHTSEHGYTETAPPLLVRDDVMFGTGQLPKFADDQFDTKLLRAKVDPAAFAGPFGDFIYQNTNNELAREKIIAREELDKFLEDESNFSEFMSKTFANTIVHSMSYGGEGLSFSDSLNKVLNSSAFERLWLIPTAEVPLTNLAREDILDEAALPMRVAAFTPCFRAEAGAAGRDTRGMIRQHQFSKVELVSVTTPEASLEELERKTACAEEVLKRLGLPYRVVTLCTGDLGFSSRKTYDIEVWLPGQDTYREISSCSVCSDFQARRMNARYRPADGKGTRFVHTLNGSGVAVGRALVAVLENYQNEDGSVTVPEVLKPYMGGLEVIRADD
ncbi:serine--tRNA ligase [Kaustia mangrovi]|uniref:Serine--tRNA ligase n=1 Tax=Kaustia mangrovi TaxID=2593653 RepID=A0A7S8C1K1_9HYPH|nr:serine--tRNA ligase [Kaustia mangrovi]QPC41679.1 serine--tRNA ligase [Kaustia mangrovi]